MFESESVLLECPKGNSSLQRWIKRSHEMKTGEMINFTDYSNEGPEYGINSTQLSDGGYYDCYEGKALLLTVDLRVHGELYY